VLGLDTLDYKLSTRYCLIEEIGYVKMYFVENIPFTFDELEPIMQCDPAITYEASINPEYEMEDLWKWSNYLIMEECHPMMYVLNLKNPELLPD
jgi:hypothetical protein